MEILIERAVKSSRDKNLTRYRLEYIVDNFDTKTNQEIADELNVSKAYIFYLYKRLGLSRKEQRKRFLLKIIEKNKEKSITEIAKIAGVSYNTINRLIPEISKNKPFKKARKIYPCSRFDDLFKKYNCNSVFNLREKLGHKKFEQEIRKLNK